MKIGPMPLPPGLMLQGPDVILPLRAVGAIIMDAQHQTVANCPNSPLADLLAYTVNEALCPQVHRS